MSFEALQDCCSRPSQHNRQHRGHAAPTLTLPVMKVALRPPVAAGPPPLSATTRYHETFCAKWLQNHSNRPMPIECAFNFSRAHLSSAGMPDPVTACTSAASMMANQQLNMHGICLCSYCLPSCVSSTINIRAMVEQQRGVRTKFRLEILQVKGEVEDVCSHNRTGLRRREAVIFVTAWSNNVYGRH